MNNDTPRRVAASLPGAESAERLARAIAALGATLGIEGADVSPAKPPEQCQPEPVSERTGKQPGARPSRATRRALAAQERRRAHVERVRAAGAPEYDPRDWAGGVWHGCRAMYLSPRRVVELLAELPRALAIRIRRAALGVERDAGGTWRRARSWQSIRARVIAAIGWALWRHGLATRRGGCARVCVGVSQAMIGALFPKLDGGRGYSRSWIAATSAGRRGDQRGPLALLRDAGVFWSVQPPATVAPMYAGPPSKRGGRRWAFCQYCFDAALVADGACAYALDVDDDVIRACRGELGDPRPVPADTPAAA